MYIEKSVIAISLTTEWLVNMCVEVTELGNKAIECLSLLFDSKPSQQGLRERDVFSLRFLAETLLVHFVHHVSLHKTESSVRWRIVMDEKLKLSPTYCYWSLCWLLQES